jgi:hypothetical protein
VRWRVLVSGQYLWTVRMRSGPEDGSARAGRLFDTFARAVKKN